MFQVLIGILTIDWSAIIVTTYLLDSSPYRYSNNSNEILNRFKFFLVSSPYRYSNNYKDWVSVPEHRWVSSPYRYSNNSDQCECISRCNSQFQVLIGILTIGFFRLCWQSFSTVSSPYRYSNNWLVGNHSNNILTGFKSL